MIVLSHSFGSSEAKQIWLAYDGTKDSTEVTLGTITQNDPLTTGFDIAILSDTRAIIACADVSNSDYGTLVLVDTSGLTPVILDTIVFNSDVTEDIRIAKIDSRYATVYFLNSVTESAQIIDSNSDTLALVGTQQDISASLNRGSISSGGHWAFAYIDTAEHICAFRNADVSNNLHSVIISLDTSTGAVTVNTPTQHSSDDTHIGRRLTVQSINTASFVFALIQDGGATLPLHIGSGTKSGTAITAASYISNAIGEAGGKTQGSITVSDDGLRVYCSARMSYFGGTAILDNSGGILSGKRLRGTEIATSSQTAVQPALLRYVETINNKDYFVGVSVDGDNQDKVVFTGFEYDPDIQSLRSSGTLVTHAIRSDVKEAMGIISKNKILFMANDINDSNKLKMVLINN